MTDIEIVEARNFSVLMLPKLATEPPARWQKRDGTQKEYCREIWTFDIETTRLPDIEHSIMYVWQFGLDENHVVVGRTWDELKRFFQTLKNWLGEAWAVVHVHNLAYEFQFLRAVHEWKPEEVFAIKTRRPVKASMTDYHLEFRCSYIHSNMSLKEYTHKMQVKHAKLSGADYDYTKIRYPWTELTEKEIAYCAHDVIGLREALEKELILDNDTWSTFPLTSTGYVRRECKQAMRGKWKYVRSLCPDIELYNLLRWAFRGGNTHANRFFVGHILHGVESWDRSSSYPDVMCNDVFPCSPFQRCKGASFEFLARMQKIGYAFIVKIAMSNVTLKNVFEPVPYISTAQCQNIVNAVRDNGRIISADFLLTCVTDIDFSMILEQYNAEIIIMDCYISKYDKLPMEFVNETEKYYRRKTELKGIAGEEIQYMKGKNKLNSEYGMTAQDPVKQSILYTMGEWREGDEPKADLLANHNKHAFLPYQWGVWVTAWARKRLQDGINLIKSIPGCFVIYVDTDSVKFIAVTAEAAEAAGQAWDEYNKIRQAHSAQSGAEAKDANGKMHYMGVYEYEGAYYEFITQGAKKYAYKLTKDDGCSVTVAGVVKAAGGAELDELGGLNAFKPGLVFVKAGGNELVYNDNADFDIEREGHILHISPNVVIRPSTYTLGYTAEYSKILGESREAAELAGLYDNEFTTI